MEINPDCLEQLERIVGTPYFSAHREDLVCYGYDATATLHVPDAVVFPSSAQQVSQIMKLAAAFRTPVIPRGGGSGMTGGALAVKGGIVVVFNRMNRIVEIDQENLIARVQPGVITAEFQNQVKRHGLFYPPDPSSAGFSTIGGNLAECAGGPKAVKYGVTRDYVLGLEAVLPTGEIVKTGVRTAKGVVGYDLTRLIVGSEGTLVLITEATVKLLPLPESVMTLTAAFASMNAAARAVSEIIRSHIVPRTIEFLDNASIRLAEGYLHVGLPVDAGALLIMEVDGKQKEINGLARALEDLSRYLGAVSVTVAETEEQAQQLWQARKAISPALFKLAPHKINEDIVVPRSRVPDLVAKIDDLRRPYLRKEISGEAISLMQRIKQAFDPLGLLNPGKIFPESIE
ncbi:MAG: FAD-binding protein [Desulfosarcina sp.]|nr:FAD-binding protein [Desulfosarcina sp.]MBC2765394.1 FAD-binding protein [Desulfosarcina sp.]